MEKQYPFGSGTVQWISTGWLAGHLDSREFMIIDAQPDIHDYIEEHIPGAVYLNEGVLRTSIDGIPGRYVPAGAAQGVFRCLGLTRDMPAVVYTGRGAFSRRGDGLAQTMVAYSLARFGHRAVYVLDGGLDAWKAEGYPLTKYFPRIAGSDFPAEVHREYFVEYDEFLTIKDSESVTLLDARPAPMYEGQGPWIKPGHIPGAISLPWQSLMSDRNTALLRSDDELRHILATHEATPDRNIIVYCGTGREATDEFLLLKWYFSYPSVRLYEGSFTEWTAHPENQTVTGSSPRTPEPAASTYW